MSVIRSERETASIEEIPKALQNVFNTLQGNYTRSTSANRIILAPPTMERVEIYEFIDSLAAAQPGRFFVLTALPEESTLVANISAYCHQLGKGRAVCSEVICIYFGPSDSGLVPSVVQAYLLTGRRTELIVLKDVMMSPQFDRYAALADVLIIDSKFHWKKTDLLRSSRDSFHQVVDVQWIYLAPWRVAIKNFFDSLVSYEELDRLRAVTIKTGRGELVQALLLFAWISSCLRMKVVSAFDGKIECFRPSGSTCTVTLIESESQCQALSEVCFSADNEYKWTLSEGIIFASVQGGLSRTNTYEHGVENEVEAVTRYLSVGESTVCYPDALSIALDCAPSFID